MEKQDKSGVLLRDREYVKFVQLLKKAEKEGRLDGEHTCGLCGMKYGSLADARQCCRATVS